MSITAPGIYPEITPDEYFAEPCLAPALTSSGIGILLRQSPAHFAAAHPAIGLPAEQRRSTAAQYCGQLVHRLALGKGCDFEVAPFDEYRTKEAKEWKADAEARGVVPVKAAEFDRAATMAATIQTDIATATQGHPYDTEVVIAWQEGETWCRAMIDVWCPTLGLALDVKTARDISDHALTGVFARGYARQDAWYRRGLDAVTGDHGRNRFRFLFVESDAPFLSRTAEIDESYRTGAQSECERALALFDRCLRADDWPGPGHYIATPPAWAIRDWIDAEMEEAA